MNVSAPSVLLCKQAACIRCVLRAAELILFGIGFTVGYDERATFGCVNVLADVILKHGTRLRQAIFNSLQLRFAVCPRQKTYRLIVPGMQFVTVCI